MSPREIKGLQALAVAKGGSLSINPNTGLPEAGFLEDILPIVATAAATYFTAGAAAPMLAGATGMSMGAAGILAGAGAGALISGGSAALQGKDAGQAALMGGIMGGIGGGMGMAGDVPADPNAVLGATTEVGTNALAVSPATGAPIDPLTGTANVPTGGIGAGSGNVAPGQMGQTMPPSAVTSAPGYMQPAPNPMNLDAQQLAQQTQAFTGDVAGYSPPKLNAGEQIMKQQADAVAAAKADPNSSWWAKQTPMEKAGYSVAGTALLGQALGNPNTNGAPTDDYTSSLKRISPNFQAQAPIQPNPYYRSQYPVYAAKGGIMSVYQDGGPVERMTQANTAMNPQGGLYPQGMIDKTQYATPTQRPTSLEVVESQPNYESRVNPITGTLMASGGLSSLGGYSDGGQLLKGPGDGVSDSIPASIANKQPARLADGEFVVPARIVSELGNGSTDAGARKLYAMMDRVQSARKKSIGKGKVAANTKADKLLPA
jgi:hypothetical protein